MTERFVTLPNRTVRLLDPLPCAARADCKRPAYVARAFPAALGAEDDGFPGQWVILPICEQCAALVAALVAKD